MEDKIILRNPQKFDVGIVTLEKPQGVSVKAGSFVVVNQNELNYLASICTLLQDGILMVDEDHADGFMQQLGVDPATDTHFMKDEDIKKKLGGTVKKMKEWLETVEAGHVLDRIYDIAVTMNLSADKLKVLAEKMPDKEFI
jgi:hypothetical protein